MANKDNCLKEYWRGKAEFADLINATVYGGKQVVCSSMLEEMDSYVGNVSKVVQRNNMKKNGHKMLDGSYKGVDANRDISMVAMKANGIKYVFFGLENQNDVHYAMPLRVMEYDTFSYLKQYSEIKRRYAGRNELKSGAEFLSGMKKSDKLLPVVTVVVYYGEDDWDAAKSLLEMMDVDDEILPYVNDYKMHLIQVKNTKLNFTNKNNEDLFSLLQILLDKSKNPIYKYNEAKNYIINNEISHNVAKVIEILNGIEVKEETEGIKVLSFVDDLKREFIAEGRQEGAAYGIINTCQEFGCTQNDIIKKLMAKLKIAEDEAVNYINKYNEEKLISKKGKEW